MLQLLGRKHKWYRTARLWRFIFLQHAEEGFWDDSPGLALALLAAHVTDAEVLAARAAREAAGRGWAQRAQALLRAAKVNAVTYIVRGGEGDEVEAHGT